jgi:hypothetical protein
MMASILGPVNPENYKIGMCCFSAMHTALRSKSKDNVSECRDLSTHWLFFHKA